MMIVCVLSHGEEGTIITSDSQKVCIEKEIIRKFNNENCDTLRGKPKLFLFQACRGQDIDYGVVQDKADSVMFQQMGMSRSVAIPPVEPKKDVSNSDMLIVYATLPGTNSDMLIVYATLPGYVALRDSQNGTHFVHSFCKVLAEHAKDTELSDLMYLVSEDLRFNSGDDFKETCVFENRLFKKLYLNPSLL
ncbi:caspase-2 [Eurytemora carolleeae]|uniref:caspase-2 n=1 Tax=Eurytemora carolleeae TaxID=1294199 RepID=UPI000C759578|nr:caspase-2 [Eurytemora carolleeae]|eukprot:XP_023337636.1 caspase-2-like [Eurytemora affinis]